MTAPPRFDAGHPASARQRAASRPDVSTWLSANAGSGKTRVLTDRVARLLLDGTDPQTILCLTYTKAAAAEMQNRLFKRLGAWAMLEDDRLRAELMDLGLGEGPDGAALPPLDHERLARARTLFAQAIETPGGLKIQTIHAFCAGLLRRFPLEAGVSPGLRELDDRDAARLRQEVAEAMAEGPLAPLVDRVAAHGVADWDAFLVEVVARRAAFAGPWPEADLRAALGLGAGDRAEDLPARVLGPDGLGLLAAIRDACRTGKGATDAAAAGRLDLLCRTGAVDARLLETLEDLLLAKTGEKAGQPKALGTKAVRTAHPETMEAADALAERVAGARDIRLALAALDRARALHEFGAAFASDYEARKQARGALDFDDLIERARRLLTDPAVAQWVLWRLDGGLDHILVDEAQDTSPQQWAVIERLADEFAAGEGARPRPRTIFVVGDLKQSIYSFQGADPEGFGRMRRHFGQELGRIGRELVEQRLEYSFRSAEAVLKAVDATFAGAEGLGEGAPKHEAFKAAMPGRVDLWPVVPKEEGPAGEPPPWHRPEPRTAPRDPALTLAARVAEAAEAMLKESLPVADGEGWARRPVRPGDILVLVRGRKGSLFSGIIRELKRRGLPVAGADRMELGAELAVRDIEAVLRVLALPEDDLSLACALKSPLFGWSEDRLFRLAQPRTGPLWDALDAGGDAVEGTACEALAVFRDLRARADFLRPFELIQRLLLRHDGRRRLLARLGAEAEDGIDALLAQALAHEREAVPSLTGFLEWRAAQEVEIKRQLDAEGDRIRVMTVHGAKGLESPIVILPDCGKPRRSYALPPLVPVEGSAGPCVLWAPAKEERPAALHALHARGAEADRAERRRLLYVAMTRAESWLVVAAAGEEGEPGQSWYADVRAGLVACKAAEHPFPWGAGLRFGGGWDHLPAAALPAAAAPAEAAGDPGPAAPPPPRTAPLAPSGLGGPKAILDADEADEGEDPEARAAAQARGTLLHLALEHLATAGPEATLALCEATEAAALAGDLAAIVAEAGRLIAAPGLAPLLGPPPKGVLALPEAALAGDLPGLGPLRGTVDRLLVGAEEIRVIDFKSNRRVPETPEAVPEAILRQMGAYLGLLESAFPGRRVVPVIVWTATATAMELPCALVRAALQRAAAERAPLALTPPGAVHTFPA